MSGGDPPIVDVARAPEGDPQGATAVICEFCDGWLTEHIADGTLATELHDHAHGDPIQRLHEHLVRFGFTVELSNHRDEPPVPSEDLEQHRWGSYTTRAVRMFAKHPRVADESERIVEDATGRSLTPEIA